MIIGVVLATILSMIFVIIFITTFQQEDYNSKLISVLNEKETPMVQNIFSFEFDRAYIFDDCYISGEGFAKRYHLDISIDQVKNGVSENVQRIVFVNQSGDFVYEFRCDIGEVILQEQGMIIYPDTKIEIKSNTKEKPVIICFQSLEYYNS